MSDRDHWDTIYADKAPTEVSWYQAHLERSLAWIDGLGLEPGSHIVDVGGGASTLVDDLVARGYEHVTVADLSGRALARAQERLGGQASRVRWVVGDVTTELFEPDSIDLWHDRAVFHFLTDDAQRAAYLGQVHRCVRPGACAIIATFAPGGPERCSGLPVVRHSALDIAAALGPGFELVDSADESHATPAGGSQAFAYALCRRRA